MPIDQDKLKTHLMEFERLEAEGRAIDKQTEAIGVKMAEEAKGITAALHGAGKSILFGSRVYKLDGNGRMEYTTQVDNYLVIEKDGVVPEVQPEPPEEPTV